MIKWLKKTKINSSVILTDSSNNENRLEKTNTELSQANTDQVLLESNKTASQETDNLVKKIVNKASEGLGPKQVEVHAPAKVPFLSFGYTVPSVKTTLEPIGSQSSEAWEPYALEVLAGILDLGESGRFNKSLIHGSQIAASANAEYEGTARYQTQFLIYAIPSPTADTASLQKALENELEKLKTQLVTPEELERVKTQLIAKKTFSKDSVFEQALEMGLLETVGLGWQYAERYAENINKVTAEQLQKVAQRYFLPSNKTTALLVPEQNAAKKEFIAAPKKVENANTNSSDASKKVDNKSVAIRTPFAPKTPAEAALAKTEEVVTATNTQAFTNIKRWTTSQGVPVIFYETKTVPMLEIDLAFAAGTAYEGKQYGLSVLTTSLLNQGNASFSAAQMAEQLESTGARFIAGSTPDMAILSLTSLTMPAALTKAVDAFHLIATAPRFDEAEFKGELNRQQLAVKSSQDIPDQVATELFYKNLYGDHPYAHPRNGTQESLQALQVADVRRFYQNYFVAKNAVLVMVGAVDEAKARELSETILKDLPAGTAAPAIPEAKALTQAEQRTQPSDRAQAFVRLGQVGINYNSPKFFPLLVGNYTLGGGVLVSQLSKEIRENRGLTYGVTSQFSPLAGLGPFYISFSTQNAKKGEATELAQTILANFVKQGPSTEELEAAKRYLIGSFPLSVASNGGIAQKLLLMSFYHLPEDYLNTYEAKVAAVSKEEVQAAFQELIHPNKMLLVTLG